MENFINNEEYEKGNNGYSTDETNENVVSMEEKKQIRPAFAKWDVGEKTIDLKLTTQEVLELEKKFRRNLISILGDEDDIPPLTTMLQIIHAAALPWNHGIKMKDIQSMYDSYVKNGGTQLNLYVDVYLKIYMVSGFFSNSMVEEMSDSMERMQENM